MKNCSPVILIFPILCYSNLLHWLILFSVLRCVRVCVRGGVMLMSLWMVNTASGEEGRCNYVSVTDGEQHDQ